MPEIAGALVVLLATMHNHINFWELYPALVIGSVFAQFHAAAYDSSVVLLMPESRYNRANGLVPSSARRSPTCPRRWPPARC